MLLVDDDRDYLKQYEQQLQLDKALQKTKLQLALSRLRPPQPAQTPVIPQDDRLQKAQDALADAKKQLVVEQQKFANIKI
jgi:hypothetical protein